MRDTEQGQGMVNYGRRAAGRFFGNLSARVAAHRGRRVSRVRGRGAAVEPLEDRRLFAINTPIISEFLAINDSGIEDEDDNRPDWIELHNPTAGDINLDGYFLTDDPADLDKWRLPAVTLRSNGYLIVWASGKDRAAAGSPLHTNFSLDGPNGEYLALVAPDRTTLLSQFSPTFPPQGSDVSYGVTAANTTTTLIGQRNTARTRVPVQGENMTAWLQPTTFNDSSWIGGFTGVGYETDSPPPPVPGFRVRMVDTNGGTDGQITHIGEATSILDGTAAPGAFTIAGDATAVRPVVNFSGSAFGSDQPFPITAATTADVNAPVRTDYAMRATAAVTIPAGEWTIAVHSDDGFRLRIPGVSFITRTNENYEGTSGTPAADTLVYGGQRGASNPTFATFTVPAGGLTATLQLDTYERQGGDSLELSIASGHRASLGTGLMLLGNDVLGWKVADPTTLGPPNYRALLGTDVQAQMYNVNTTALVRVPFSVDNATDFDTLRLQMKYDDGFVAYVNGVEVARRNAPASLTYNAQATTSRPDEQALVYESFSIPATSLRDGSNVLAIHALNASRDSSDLLVYPELQGFRSTIGLAPKFFATPTPGEPNVTPPSLGVVADTKFSVDRGFYEGPFQLEITTATAGAQIYYTTNGTVPSPTNGTLYTGPVTVDRTTTLRAAAFRDGFVPSNADTQTYVFLNDVIRQPEGVAPGPEWPAPTTSGQWIDYGMDQAVVNANAEAVKQGMRSLPTFSIVMKTGDLFDPTTGIYTHPHGDGRVWERPTSLELIYPDGRDGFQIDAGLRIRGGFSRSTSNPKHAFRLFFRNEYDGNLKFPVFGPDAAQSFNGFDLRTFQNYSWAFQNDSRGTFMRDMVNRDLQLAMGHDAERGDYYHLYINGHYWGIYNAAERAEANHGADYFGGESEDYDVIKVDPDLGHNIEATDGNMDAWNQLYTLLSGTPGTVSESVLQRVLGNNPDGTRNPAYPVLLDLENLIDYMLVIYWGGNRDAPISDFIRNESPNNFFALRNRNGDAGFRFYVHDAEHTMLPWDSRAVNRLGPNDQPGTGWYAGTQGVHKSNPQYFLQQIWHLDSVKLKIADRVQKHMIDGGGVLTDAKVQEIHNRRAAQLSQAVHAESARWGDAAGRRSDSFTQATWQGAVGVVQNWINGRTGVVIDQMRRWNLLPPINAPLFNRPGGQVPQDFQITLSKNPPTSPGMIYYTLDGSDPRLPNGAVSGSAVPYTGPITVDDTKRIRARTLNGTTWSALTEAVFTIDIAAIRITELMYNPAPPPVGSPYGAQDFEFLEVMNTGATDRDLTDVRITGGIEFTFPQGYRLPAGARALVVKNQAAFRSRYGDLPGIVAGEFADQLSNGGELLRIVSATGQPSLGFTYNDAWYPQTDGEGFSLNIIDPSGPLTAWNLKQSWAASHRGGGTPGAPNDSLPGGIVIVNEVLADPEPGSATGDFIEIRNTTAADVDVSGWFLSDSAAAPNKFRIPDGTILPANGYLAFNQAQLGFDISRLPGEIFVSAGDAAGNLLGYRESKRYGLGDAGFSFGEYVKTTGGTDFVALQSPTPGAANGPARVGPVVINELMYHPPGSGPEYIELRNLTGSDVLLHDPANPALAWKLTDGIDYVFPAGAVVPAFGFALVVSVDEQSFRSAHELPPGVRVYGPYTRADGTNTLHDLGENLTLYRRTADGDVLVDRVNFTNATPWPTGARGSGRSIGRLNSATYGNDAGNWGSEVVLGSPGRVNHDTTGPTVDIVDVSPDPRTDAVDSVTIVFTEPVAGFTVSNLRLSRDGGPNLLTGAEALSSADAVTWTLSGLAALTGAAGGYTLSFVSSNVTDWAGNLVAAGASDSWRVGGVPTGRVVGRHVFYNGSAFDGPRATSAGVNAADDNAIATDKQALHSGQTASFANYTSYSRGLNGVMVDVAGLLADLSHLDFEFKLGNDADVGAWTEAPQPLSVTRRAGAGVDGSDRITVRWADGAIKNRWLRVTVLPNGRTGLPSADVFYFGHLAGEVGDSATSAATNALDYLAVRRALSSSALVPITSRFDINRDRRVNSMDLALVRSGMSGSSLTLLTAPQPPAAAAAGTTTTSLAAATATTSSSDSVVTAPAPQTVRPQPARRGSILAEETDLLGRS